MKFNTMKTMYWAVIAFMVPAFTYAAPGKDTLQELLVTLSGFLKDILIPFLFGIAFLFFLINMVRYFIIGGANQAAREKAKRSATYGLAAFVFLFTLWGIVAIIVDGVDIEESTSICPDYMGDICNGEGSDFDGGSTFPAASPNGGGASTDPDITGGGGTDFFPSADGADNLSTDTDNAGNAGNAGNAPNDTPCYNAFGDIYQCGTDPGDGTTGNAQLGCTDAQKQAQACTSQYAPVCGYQNVQCVSAPCDPIQVNQYSNSCGACSSGEIDSYVIGACPAGDDTDSGAVDGNSTTDGSSGGDGSNGGTTTSSDPEENDPETSALAELIFGNGKDSAAFLNVPGGPRVEISEVSETASCISGVNTLKTQSTTNLKQVSYALYKDASNQTRWKNITDSNSLTSIGHDRDVLADLVANGAQKVHVVHTHPKGRIDADKLSMNGHGPSAADMRAMCSYNLNAIDVTHAVVDWAGVWTVTQELDACPYSNKALAVLPIIETYSTLAVLSSGQRKVKLTEYIEVDTAPSTYREYFQNNVNINTLSSYSGASLLGLSNGHQTFASTTISFQKTTNDFCSSF